MTRPRPPWWMPGPHLVMLGRARPAFHLVGTIGLVAAVGLGAGLLQAQGAPLWPFGVVDLVAVATFLALAMAAKAVSGVESLTFYHHLIAVTAASASTLYLLGRPVLLYLDVVVLGVGLFAAFGRVGCLMVGCCHGRPSAWGVRYGNQHAEAGFSRFLVGVPLFPVQAVESVYLLVIAGGGTVIALTPHRPGDVFTWFLIAYGAGRFGLEFLRGDAVRSYLWGFSEAQWTSLVLTASVALGEWRGLFPFHGWHAAVAGGLAVALTVVAAYRRLGRPEQHLLLHPRHVQEVAVFLAGVSESLGVRPGRGEPRSTGTDVPVARTSLGVQLSGGEVSSRGVVTRHYALSSTRVNMDESMARTLGDLIVLLQGLPADYELVPGQHGVFHLLAPASPTPPPRSVIALGERPGGAAGRR